MDVMALATWSRMSVDERPCRARLKDCRAFFADRREGGLQDVAVVVVG